MHKTPEITRLIHDNFHLIMAFSFSQPVLRRLLDERFAGEWKFLRKSLFEYSEIRADRALLEMATQLRVLDDAQKLNDYLRATRSEPLGTVTQEDDKVTDLHFRDFTNKVMHASEFQWDFSDEHNPKVICLPNDSDRWRRAEIDLVRLTGLIGCLML